MANIIEPKSVDFVFKSEPLTEVDRKMISKHILAYKQKKNKLVQVLNNLNKKQENTPFIFSCSTH
jgi:hypothetical protein